MPVAEEVGQTEQTKKRLAKRKIKDTVFSKLFGDYDNLLLLYKALHPEDTEVTVKDLQKVDLRKVFVHGLCNDLSFKVRDKYILLLEAQSTWSPNILPRILMYYANFLLDHIKKTKQNIYGTKKVNIPCLDAYVVYTGHHKVDKSVISLKDEFWAGKFSAVDLKAKVICLEKSRDLNIVEQYIRFAQIYDACMWEDKKKGKEKPDADTVKRAIDICLNEGVLIAFLTKHVSEVVDTMRVLFDEKYLREVDRYEAYQEGEARGRTEGEANLLRRLHEMHNAGKSMEEILAACSI